MNTHIQEAAEELAREIMCHFVVSLDQSVKTKERLALILAPLFTRLQESERVLRECVNALKVADDRLHMICGSYMSIAHGEPESHFYESIDTMGDDMSIVSKTSKLATTHLNK